jgi:hypothetical protein
MEQKLRRLSFFYENLTKFAGNSWELFELKVKIFGKN